MMTNTYLPHVGGVARSVHTFTEDLRRRRQKVLIVAPSYPGDDQLPARVERHVVRLASLKRFNDSDYSVRLPLTWMMNPVLHEFTPDIVHSHHPYLMGDSALRYAAARGVPVVFTHHTLHEEYTHNLPIDVPALKQFVIELSTRYANLCDAVIAPSESIASLIRQRGVESQIEIIPTGIDIRALASGAGSRFRAAHGIPAGAMVIGHLGRLAIEKNLGFLARAVGLYLKQDLNARFLVVGSGPYEEEMRRIFRRRRLLNRVTLAGSKTGQDLHDSYGAMDVFAFSSHTETQGLVVVEAMAAGLPVVALDASGVREVVRDGENGFLLDARANEAEFAACLAQLARDSVLRRACADHARRSARLYSRERSAARLLELYERTIRNARGKRSAAEERGFKALLKRLQIEWKLASEKAESVVEAISGNGTRKRTARTRGTES
jgi:glycosyltransferase involved in cell wall biosynthesis